MNETILLAVGFVASLFVMTWLFGKLHEARQHARGCEGESLIRLEALQQMNERCRELEGQLADKED